MMRKGGQAKAKKSGLIHVDVTAWPFFIGSVNKHPRH